MPLSRSLALDACSKGSAASPAAVLQYNASRRLEENASSSRTGTAFPTLRNAPRSAPGRVPSIDATALRTGRRESTRYRLAGPVGDRPPRPGSPWQEPRVEPQPPARGAAASTGQTGAASPTDTPPPPQPLGTHNSLYRTTNSAFGSVYALRCHPPSQRAGPAFAYQAVLVRETGSPRCEPIVPCEPSGHPLGPRPPPLRSPSTSQVRNAAEPAGEGWPAEQHNARPHAHRSGRLFPTRFIGTAYLENYHNSRGLIRRVSRPPASETPLVEPSVLRSLIIEDAGSWRATRARRGSGQATDIDPRRRLGSPRKAALPPSLHVAEHPRHGAQRITVGALKVPGKVGIASTATRQWKR